jgi:hypothetical protein
MEQSPFVSLRQWIASREIIVEENTVIVGSRDDCAQAQGQAEN